MQCQVHFCLSVPEVLLKHRWYIKYSGHTVITRQVNRLVRDDVVPVSALLQSAIIAGIFAEDDLSNSSSRRRPDGSTERRANDCPSLTVSSEQVETGKNGGCEKHQMFLPSCPGIGPQ